MAKVLMAGWGYWQEYCGNFHGDFHRAVEDMEVTIEDTPNNPNPNDTYVRLPNGKRAKVATNSLVGIG